MVGKNSRQLRFGVNISGLMQFSVPVSPNAARGKAKLSKSIPRLRFTKKLQTASKGLGMYSWLQRSHHFQIA